MFSSLEEAEMALDRHEIDMQAKGAHPSCRELRAAEELGRPSEVKVLDPREGEDEVVKEERFHDGTVLFATSYGRILFNETLPTDYPFVQRAGGQRAVCPRSSMTSPCVTPPSRWPPRWMP